MPSATDQVLTEAQELKAWICALLAISNEVDDAQPHLRREALEVMQREIQNASALIRTWAADLEVEIAE